MAKLFDLVVKTGSYEKNGETKGRYKNVGTVMQGENGMYILLDRTFNPAGVVNPDNKDVVTLSMYEPKEKSSNAQSFDDAPF